MTEPDAQPWFPEFCNPRALVAVSIAAQGVAMILMLAPGNFAELSWNEVGLKSLFTQLIALWSAALLCGTARLLDRCAVPLGALLAWLMVLGVAALATVIGYWLDRTLNLGALGAGSQPVPLLAGNLSVVALVTAMALRYFYVQSRWRNDLESRAQAQVQALQARIRPHFLFNSLNTIASLVESRPGEAERAIEDLADLFRATLRNAQQEIALADELELCRRYLSIEKLRLGERLEIAWQIVDLPMHQPVPPLLVQPLIENAVHHGIARMSKRGTLTVSGGRSGSRWWIEIRNPLPARQSPRPGGAGIAVSNIRRRINHRFGSSAKLENRTEESHYIVRLELPLDREYRRD